MQYVRLGKTGVKVSRVCLGCMSYGTPGKGLHPWALGEEQARPFFRQALEAGITFFDTANVYSGGVSEEITGRMLREMAPRESYVLATKVNGRMRPDANGVGLSRKAIMQEMEASLRRLGVEYVDLYQIHRWDYLTPIEETLEALHDLVKAGKTRYIGASSMWAFQFAQALHAADRHLWTRFVSMQNHYNLLYREEEREMMKLCAAEGIGVIPWSPLARGLLARPGGAAKGETERAGTDEFAKKLYAKTAEADGRLIAAVEKVAQERGVAMSQVALAWHFTKAYVTAPIVGATKPHHIADAAAAVELKLSAEEVAMLEGPYEPHAIAGHE